MAMKFYAQVNADPDSQDYGKILSVGRLDIDVVKDVFISERYQAGEWVDDLNVFSGVTGIESSLDWYQVPGAKVDQFTKGAQVRIDDQAPAQTVENMLARQAQDPSKVLARQLTENKFEGHRGRPGKVGGSQPKSAGTGPSPKSIAVPKGSAEAIEKLLRERPFGFSYRPMDKSAPTSGYMSSVSDGPIFSPDEPRKKKLAIIQGYLDEKESILGEDNMFVGGWLNDGDDGDGMFYLDASKNYQDLTETMGAASSTKQKSVFDVKAIDIIWVADWLEQNPDFEAGEGVREWYKVHPR